MTKNNFLRHLSLLWCLVLSSALSAQTTVLTEDFEGASNIFGVTETALAVGKASVYNSNLTGFGKVLAVCNTTAEATLSSPVAVGDGQVTIEWDAFHGYLGSSLATTLSLLNSDGKVIAAYTYDCKACSVTDVTIGEQSVAGFEAFNCQNANGFGGNGKPYNVSNYSHISVNVNARGGVTMVFNRSGNELKKVLGSVGSLTKDIAKVKIESKVNNTDRVCAFDNFKITTDTYTLDPNYIEGISNVAISGAERLTFGPTPDEAYSNPYSVVITGTDGTNITEETISDKVTDFNIAWDIEGFKTQNDTEGQYCDSYGAFSVNNSKSVATNFNLRNVPMNFFGKLVATITYNGTTTKAEKYVVALGDPSSPTGYILPQGGYPANISAYPDALAGYKLTGETYGNASDLIVGGWCVAGSDAHNGTLLKDADGTKYVRLAAATAKKSHVMTHKIEAPTGQLLFKNRLRFNNAGAVMTLTAGYPFWSSSSSYSCPVTLSYSGSNITLNGTALKNGDNAATFQTGNWYDVVLSVDKSTETCYALVYSADGQLLAESGIVAWDVTSNPTYFSIGMGNNNTGSVDMASYEAYQPLPANFQLTADKTTLSIPNKEEAQLVATVTDDKGYAVIGKATWTVVEEDMQSAVIITPDATDSHKAKLTLSETAEAGTATIQVNIAGMTKTIEINLTSSAESVKFTESTTSITIPLDADEVVTATFAAIVIDGDGNDQGKTVTLAAYDKEGTTPFTNTDAISFDAATGVLSVKATAVPTLLTIRATGKNSTNEELTKSIRVNIHGMKFDFGLADDNAVAEGYTLVGTTTTYSDVNGYGIKSGSPVVGGTASATDAKSDYLQGAFEFDFKVTKGAFYSVEITYQGTLSTGYINSDLAGYELGNSETMTTATFTIPATRDIIDLRISGTDCRIAQISITKEPARQKRGNIVVHHIGDSTSANNGSWAHRLASIFASAYSELAALCDFKNNGRGGRNLSTYYTQGLLANVLADIYPGDILMLGNMGTNGMGSSFEADVNYYLDAAEALGAKIIINSYSPHGAVSSYASGYNSSTHTFNSYRKDGYDTTIRKVAGEREKNDDNYMGFVEIGKNADAAFNAYVADYAKNGHASADAAAQAIITCFTDHNHYSNGTLACDLMLNGYGDIKGIVAQLIDILKKAPATGISLSPALSQAEGAIYDMQGRRIGQLTMGDEQLTAGNGQLKKGLYIIGGKKVVVR